MVDSAQPRDEPSLTHPALASVEVDSATGAVSGVPAQPSAGLDLVIGCYGPGTYARAGVQLTVALGPPAIEYPPLQHALQARQPMEQLDPVSSGSPADGFTAEGLPAGLAIDPVSGAISGVPEELCAAREVHVLAVNAAGGCGAKVSITVVDLPPLVAYPPLVLNVGTPVSVEPENTGGAVRGGGGARTRVAVRV